MIGRTVSFPTLYVRVRIAFEYGGRMRQPGETLWLTPHEHIFRRGNVEVLQQVSEHRMREWRELARERLGR